jgi:hypothetical protein
MDIKWLAAIAWILTGLTAGLMIKIWRENK